MAQKLKKKLCWNCDGSANLEVENCPYCGVYLSPLGTGGEEKEGIFAPPYRMVVKEDEEEVPAVAYSTQEQATKEENTDEGIGASAQMTVPETESGDEMRKVLLCSVLLSGGSILMLFAGVLWLFSQENMLTLRWDSSYWSLYLLIGFPMLAFGCWLLSSLSDNNTNPES
jgi:hypothetical protein